MAQIWKVHGDNGEFRGGPAYYIQQALHSRWLGIVFAVSLILCFALGFNGLQTYNMSSSIEYFYNQAVAGVDAPAYFETRIPLVIGILLAVAFGFTLFGGVHRISALTSVIVPVMAILYLVLALVMMIMNASALPAVFGLIFSEAFDFGSIVGGFAGSMIVQGIKRGLFSNDASIIFMTVAIFAFAFSSLIGNYFYAEQNLKFITESPTALFVFRIVCALVVFFGAQSNLTLAWNLADIFMGIEAIINIVVILILGKWAFMALDDYKEQKKAGLDPVFVADNFPGMPATECWHETRDELQTVGDGVVFNIKSEE